MTNDGALQQVIAYVEAHPDQFEEDYARKVRQRAEVVNDPDHPGKVVIDVERHHGWLGARYERGQPLRAFITYWQRWVFDPIAQTMEYRGVARPSEWDAGVCTDLVVRDYGFKIERLGENSFRISEFVTKETAVVKDRSEAEWFAERLAEGLNLEGEVVGLAECFPPGQLGECETEIGRIIAEELKQKVQDAWDELHDEEQEV